MQYLLGIDIGTQGTKTDLFDIDGNIISGSMEPSNLINKNGMIYQDPDEIFLSVIHTIKDVMEKSGVSGSDVAGIAIDSQMAGIMGIDEDFEAVTYYDSWLDNTCKDYIDIIKDTCNETVVELTGAPVSNTHGPKIMWWKNERPEVYAKIKKFVLPGIYVAGRMAGLKADAAVMDYTNIHFSGFADNKNKTWSKMLLQGFEVSESKMPRIASPFEVFGRLTKQSAEAMGLIQGVPIVTGCGDTAANCFGAGIVEAGQAFDVAGTASVFACCVDEFKPDIKHDVMFNMRSVIEGCFTPLAYIGGGGLCIRWFKEGLTGQPAVTYDELQEEAFKVPAGCEGLTFIPHFEGRVCPSDQDLKGSFSGLSFKHTRAHMYRSIMEGIAYEYKFYYEVLKELGHRKSLTSVSCVGGGAKSVLFNQIKADVLGVPYHPMKVTDCATLGCAVIAGVGVGLYNDAKGTIARLNEKLAPQEPDDKNREVYSRAYNRYIDTLEGLSEIYKKVK